ncbi:MAG TPA: acetolactate synthase large subunit [Thermodesulfobacteriota bacterium]|nr:acetolactate synthase large subunit [Thermodesulfobacteriota bacterium]
MTVAELVVRCLEQEGVRYVFGLPGEEVLELVDALGDSSVRLVTTRHEQGAAFMADVYGRLSGRAGVCLSTLGPGATNLLTGVADANMDRAPLVAITGQASLDRMHKESHQYLDLVTLFRSVTKWNAEIRTPGMTAEAVRKAFKVAQTEKPGATHLELPEDVARMAVDDAPLFVQQPVLPEPVPAQVARAVRVLDDARRPIILAGGGVARAGAAQALTRFAERLGIPVVTTFMGKGAIPASHPLHLGAIGVPGRDYLLEALAEEADLVIAVGYDLVEISPHRWNPRRDRRILHVDAQPAEVDAAYIVAVGLVGDLARALDELAAHAAPKGGAGFDAARRRAREEAEEEADDPAFPMKPARVVAELRRALAPDDIVVADVGVHKLWLGRRYPCERPNTCVISNGFAAMGIAVPGAIAAKLLHPERTVVAATGDGGFLMNSQELETAVRLGTPFVTLVFNDRTFGLIRYKQQRQFGRAVGVDFDNPDLVRYAESFGAAGLRVEGADELAPALREAIASRKVAVVDCPVDWRANAALAP